MSRIDKNDLYLMKIALKEAEKAFPDSMPNPPVGAVLVKNGEIISKGYTDKCGGDHAEIRAIKNALKKNYKLKNTKMYVTLEPCSHFGRTPPCSDRIIKEKISEVIIATDDPNPLVNGKGIKMLNETGIKTKTGILADSAKYIMRFYFKNTKEKLPYITIKTAHTIDGKTASVTGNSKWISNEKSRKEVHRLRNNYDAILSGIGTILADDPMLNVRGIKKNRNPVRIIIDRDGKLDKNFKIISTAAEIRTIIITDKKNSSRLKKLSPYPEILSFKKNKNYFSWHDIFSYLFEEKNIRSVFIESGGNLNSSLLKEGMIDDIYSFTAPLIIGGAKAPTAFEGKGIKKVNDGLKFHLKNIKKFDNDIMSHYIRKDL